MQLLRRIVMRVAFSLLTLVATAYAEEAWESETAGTCSQNAWTLIGLGAVGIVVILKLGGASISNNEMYYRNPWWRLAWWASCLSLLAGFVLFRVYCNSRLGLTPIAWKAGGKWDQLTP
jgi:hypothetical protein